MAPEVGLEPTTLRLTAECSAIELLRSVLGHAKLTRCASTVIANTDIRVKDKDERREGTIHLADEITLRCRRLRICEADLARLWVVGSD